MLIGAGDPVEVPGRGDTTYPFRAHSEYFYLTDRNRPGGALAFDPHEGWFDFVVRASTSERAAQVELEAAAFRRGADAMAYDTIVGSGPNAAVLHFAPSARRFRSGELVLIDAGAERDGHASDVTRTYPVGGELSSEQRELHSLVHAAEGRRSRSARRGAMARRASHGGAGDRRGPRRTGILRGAPETLLETGAVWLFFPHGIGHLVGLGVRDAGGTLPERRDKPPPFPNLRIDLPLRPGMVVTVEPGIYFIPAILEDVERRRRHAGEVDWDRVDGMLAFGGIRIEDNVLIAESGPRGDHRGRARARLARSLDRGDALHTGSPERRARRRRANRVRSGAIRSADRWRGSETSVSVTEPILAGEGKERHFAAGPRISTSPADGNRSCRDTARLVPVEPKLTGSP